MSGTATSRKKSTELRPRPGIMFESRRSSVANRSTWRAASTNAWRSRNAITDRKRRSTRRRTEHLTCATFYTS